MNSVLLALVAILPIAISTNILTLRGGRGITEMPKCALSWPDRLRNAARKSASSGRVPAMGSLPTRPFRATDLSNDLEAPCFQRYPTLDAIRGRLEAHGATGVIMSGSGPTVFGLFESRSAARAAMTAMTERDRGETVDAFLVRALRRQPGVSSWKSPRSASSRSTKRS